MQRYMCVFIVVLIFLSVIVKSVAVFAAESKTDVPEEEPDIRVLAIGNSFSEDATTYLQKVAEGGSVNMYVGNLYIGGCSLETHWSNAQSDAKAYKFFRYYDRFTTKEGVSIKEALESLDWDYVVMQQVSHLSGQLSTYEPYLSNLYAYVKELEPDAEILLHQTWAYEKDSVHEGFANYNRDQGLMFESLKNTNNKLADKLDMRIIPCGEAMQNARKDPLFDYGNGGRSLCRDGFHASIPQGRYLLAAVWYEVLTGNSILVNDATIPGIKDEELSVLKQAAHDAVSSYKPQEQPTQSATSELYVTDEVKDDAWYTNRWIIVVAVIAIVILVLGVFFTKKN